MTEDLTGPGARKEDVGSGASGRRQIRQSLPERVPLPTRVNDLAPLPPQYEAALAAGLRSIPADLTPEQAALIADHVRLLLAWNGAINLTAIREPEAIATSHVLDSLAALPILRSAGVEEFVDLGSGAGYPGLPLAVVLPARRALLVDSVGKKARFLAVVVEALGLAGSIAVAPVRAETLAADPAHRGQWPAVLARAVADLGELAELALPLLRVGGLLVAWKRLPIDHEQFAARAPLRILGGALVERASVSVPGLEDHALLVIEKIGPTADRFPREPRARRRPLR